MKEIKFFNNSVIRIINPKKELQPVRGYNANFVWFDGGWFDLRENNDEENKYVVELI